MNNYHERWVDYLRYYNRFRSVLPCISCNSNHSLGYIRMKNKFEKPCKISTRYKNKDGYPTLSEDSYEGYKLEHRYIMAKHLGRDISGEVVRHLCNNPGCIEITHLAIGSQRDNILDSVKTGRYNRPKGTAHWLSTLTDDNIEDIWALHNLGMKSSDIAKEMNVSYKVIYRILRGESY